VHHARVTAGTQVQRVVRPILLVALVVSALHPLWNWLLVYHFSFGLHGAALATSLSQGLLLGGLLTAVCTRQPHAAGTWPGVRCRDATRNMRQYMVLAVPGAAMLALEWWCFEIIGFFAGGLGRK
jgi:Na+-driven multidrug efflux pump